MINQNDTFRNLLGILSAFCVEKTIVLYGQHSSWENVNTEVPYGSILRPLLFLIYLNYLSNGISSNYNRLHFSGQWHSNKHKNTHSL